MKKHVYYSYHRKQTFTIPVIGEDGKPAMRRDFQGNPKYTKDGKPIYQERLCEFKPYIDSPQRGSVCVYVIPADEKGDPVDRMAFNHLERLADDPTTKVVREDAYKQSINPQAFEMEKQLKKKEEENAFLQSQLKETMASKESAIAEMQKQLEEMTRLAEETTKPKKVKENG